MVPQPVVVVAKPDAEEFGYEAQEAGYDATELGRDALHEAKQAGRDAKADAKELGYAAQEAGHDAKEAAKDKAQEADRALGSEGETLTEKVQHVAGAAWDKTKEVAEVAWEKTKDAASTVKQVITRDHVEAAAEQLQEAALHAKDAVVEKASELQAAASEMTSNAAEVVQAKAADVTQSAIYAKDVAVAKASDLQAAASEKAADVAQSAIYAKDVAVEKASDLQAAASEKAADVAQSAIYAKDVAVEKASELQAAASEKAADATAAVQQEAGTTAAGERGMGDLPVWFRAGDELDATDFRVRDETHPEMAAPTINAVGEPQLAAATGAVPFYLAEDFTLPDAPSDAGPVATNVRGADDELTQENQPLLAAENDFGQQQQQQQQDLPQLAAGIAQQADFAPKDDFKQQDLNEDDINQTDLPIDDSEQGYQPLALAAGFGLAGAGAAQQADFAPEDDFKQQDLNEDDTKQTDLPIDRKEYQPLASPEQKAGTTAAGERGMGDLPVWFRAGDELDATDFRVRDETHPEMAAPTINAVGEPQLAAATGAVPFYLAEDFAQPDETAVADFESKEVPSARRELPYVEHQLEDVHSGNRPVATNVRGADDELPQENQPLLAAENDFGQQQQQQQQDLPQVAAGIIGVGDDVNADTELEKLALELTAAAGIAAVNFATIAQQADLAPKDDFKQQDLNEGDDTKQTDLPIVESEQGYQPLASGAGLGPAGAGAAQQADFASKDDFKQQDLNQDDTKQTDLPIDDSEQGYQPLALAAGFGLAGAGAAQQADFAPKDDFKQTELPKEDIPQQEPFQDTSKQRYGPPSVAFFAGAPQQRESASTDAFKPTELPESEVKQHEPFADSSPTQRYQPPAAAIFAGTALQDNFSPANDIQQPELPKNDLTLQNQAVGAAGVAGGGIAGAGVMGVGQERDYTQMNDFARQDLPKSDVKQPAQPLSPKTRDTTRTDMVKEDFKQQHLALTAGFTGLGVLGAGVEPDHEFAAQYYDDGRVVGQRADVVPEYDNRAIPQASANTMSDDGAPPAGWAAGPVLFSGFLRKGHGLQRARLAATSHKASYAFRSTHPLAFGALREDAVLSKPPTRHWGYEAALIHQPEINQAPNFKSKARVRSSKRLRRRYRRAIAWMIPAYEGQQNERGGVAWLVTLEDASSSVGKGTEHESVTDTHHASAPAADTAADNAEGTGSAAPGKQQSRKKKSAVGKLLKGFTGLFHKKTSKHRGSKGAAAAPEHAAPAAPAAPASYPASQSANSVQVRPQRRIVAKGPIKADVTNEPQRVVFGRVREANPPLAPIVEKKVHIDIDPQATAAVTKVEVAAAGSGITTKREMRHETVHVADMVLFRQAPAVDDTSRFATGKRVRHFAANDHSAKPNYHPETAPPALPVQGRHSG
jgi:hypothetical protein